MIASMFKIPDSTSQDWVHVLNTEFSKAYAKSLMRFLEAEKASGKVIFPQEKQWFRAFATTPLHKIKCVIIGQDPYHGQGQANGLAFSVNKGIKIPPSLRNIHKELEASLGICKPEHGDLSQWAEEGVLLLNASLTVEEAKAGSHLHHGWPVPLTVRGHVLTRVISLLRVCGT